MDRRFLGMLFFITAIACGLVTANYTINGHAIFTGSVVNTNLGYILTLVLLCISTLLVTSRVPLDAILIPTEASEERIKNKTRVGIRAYRDSGAKVIVASGGKMPFLDPKYKNEAHIVYTELRKAGIRPAEIRIDGTSRDNLENILHAVKKLDKTGAKEIGIVSYPSHLDRFQYIFDKAKEEGVIPKDIHLHRIETDETRTERAWEIPARILTKYQLRHGVRNAKTSVGPLKYVAYALAKLFS